MAKRVGVLLSGCGARDGTEVREAVVTLLAIERAGAVSVCAAPDLPQALTVDHRTGERAPAAPPRSVLAEAARIARGEIRDLTSLAVDDVDALVIPGGEGVGLALSSYADKGAVCDVHPDVVRLLKGCLSSHRPMGFICLAPVLAARVLGPIAGVRVTLGARGGAAAKHAAVMGADVRPCGVRDVMVDAKARVVSTPAYMIDDASLLDVAVGIEKLVRTVLSFARDPRPLPQPDPRAGRPTPPAPPPEPAPFRRRPRDPTRGPGSS